MSFFILDGKKTAEKIKEKLKDNFKQINKKLALAVILVGENLPSQIYVNMKKKALYEMGIECNIVKFPEDVSQIKIIEKINELNSNPDVTGILVQLPLPEQINTETILNTVDKSKDVDGLHSSNIGDIAHGNETLVSSTAKGIIKLLDEYKINIEGKHVVIINHSILVGKPLALLFLNRNATVTVCHIKTKALKEHTLKADILVSATGVPCLIKEDYIKQGAVVVDAGTAKLKDKITGDVDFDNVSKKASYITPVPGGVGPMTIAMLIENILESYKIQNKNKKYLS